MRKKKAGVFPGRRQIRYIESLYGTGMVRVICVGSQLMDCCPGEPWMQVEDQAETSPCETAYLVRSAVVCRLSCFAMRVL